MSRESEKFFDEKIRVVLVENEPLIKIFAKIGIQIMAENIFSPNKEPIAELITKAQENLQNHGVKTTKKEILESVLIWSIRKLSSGITHL